MNSGYVPSRNGYQGVGSLSVTVRRGLAMLDENTP